MAATAAELGEVAGEDRAGTGAWAILATATVPIQTYITGRTLRIPCPGGVAPTPKPKYRRWIR